MHAVMLSATPPLRYLAKRHQPLFGSGSAASAVACTGFPAYFTLDGR